MTAIATLQLEKKVQPLPADTKAIVQSVSAVGLKYLELEKGTSRQTLKAGQTIPIARRANRWTSRNSSTCSTSRRGPRSRSTRTTSATASPGAGSASTTRSTNCARSSRHAIPVLRNLARRRPGCTSCGSRSTGRPRRRRRSPNRTPNCSVTSTPSSRAWASVAPSIEAANRGGPRVAGTGDLLAAARGALL